MSKDRSTDSIQNLTTLVDEFCQERDWDQFHTLKDLAIGAVTESAELLEWFRFRTDQDVAFRLSDPKEKEKLADELADSLYFLLRLAAKADISIGDALTNKLKKNAVKYPTDKVRGTIG